MWPGASQYNLKGRGLETHGVEHKLRKIKGSSLNNFLLFFIYVIYYLDCIKCYINQDISLRKATGYVGHSRG